MAFIFNGTDIVGTGSGATELNDLTDVAITNPTDGQALLYNSTTHKFENADGGSANIPEYTYSYWLAHRAELEATGKPFIVTNAPPSPDLVAENIGYGTSNVKTALDELNTIETRVISGVNGIYTFNKVGKLVWLEAAPNGSWTAQASRQVCVIPEGFEPIQNVNFFVYTNNTNYSAQISAVNKIVTVSFGAAYTGYCIIHQMWMTN